MVNFPFNFLLQDGFDLEGFCSQGRASNCLPGIDLLDSLNPPHPDFDDIKEFTRPRLSSKFYSFPWIQWYNQKTGFFENNWSGANTDVSKLLELLQVQMLIIQRKKCRLEDYFSLSQGWSQEGMGRTGEGRGRLGINEVKSKWI